jgi:hypothetical protein
MPLALKRPLASYPLNAGTRCISSEFIDWRDGGNRWCGEQDAELFRSDLGKSAIGLGLLLKAAPQSQVLFLPGKAFKVSRVLKILRCQSHAHVTTSPFAPVQHMFRATH